MRPTLNKSFSNENNVFNYEEDKDDGDGIRKAEKKFI